MESDKKFVFEKPPFLLFDFLHLHSTLASLLEFRVQTPFSPQHKPKEGFFFFFFFGPKLEPPPQGSLERGSRTALPFLPSISLPNQSGD